MLRPRLQPLDEEPVGPQPLPKKVPLHPYPAAQRVFRVLKRQLHKKPQLKLQRAVQPCVGVKRHRKQFPLRPKVQKVAKLVKRRQQRVRPMLRLWPMLMRKVSPMRNYRRQTCEKSLPENGNVYQSSAAIYTCPAARPATEASKTPAGASKAAAATGRGQTTSSAQTTPTPSTKKTRSRYEPAT